MWESERIVQQAKKFFETGESTAGDGKGWDTCFTRCFEAVLKAYPQDGNPDKLLCEVLQHELKGVGQCSDCIWYAVPEGCNVIRDSEGCKRNKRPRIFKE